MTADSRNRQRVRENFAKRRNGINALPKLIFLDPDIFFADVDDGTLKSSIVKDATPLKAYLPDAPAGIQDAGAIVQLEYAPVINNSIGSYSPLGTSFVVATDAVFPYEVIIDIKGLPTNLTSVLRYQAETTSGSQYSDPYPIITDTIPPWQDGLGVPVVPTQVPAGTITQELLDDNTSSITYNLAKYNDYKDGDSIAVYFEDHVPEEAELKGLTPVFAGPFPQTDPKFILPAEAFVKLGSGDRFICYVLQDKAGNINISYPQTVHIALGTLPLTLSKPEVPLADDMLLDLLDAGVNPVEAMIPAYQSPEDKVDTITLHWGNKTLEEYTVNPDTSFPMPISIPKEILKSQYDTVMGGRQSLNVYYTLGRSSGWTLDSDVTTFDVDFSYVGPELPDWPNPINIDLPQPEVTGPISGKINELDAQDSGQDALFAVEVYDGVQANDVLEVFWGPGSAPAFTHTMKTEAAGDMLHLDIPWAFVEQAGNGPGIPVQYAIHNGTKPNNEQKCVPITVNVNAVSIPAPAKPTYPTEYQFNGVKLINCTSLRLFGDRTVGVPVNIPPLTDPVYKLEAGHTINLLWRPLDNQDSEIPGALITANVELDDSMIQNGFSWEIKPFDEVVKPIFSFSPDTTVKLQTSYSFNVDSAIVSSEIADIKLTMTKPDHDICDIPTTPFP